MRLEIEADARYEPEVVAIAQQVAVDDLRVHQTLFEEENFRRKRSAGEILEGFECRAFHKLAETEDVDLKLNC